MRLSVTPLTLHFGQSRDHAGPSEPRPAQRPLSEHDRIQIAHKLRGELHTTRKQDVKQELSQFIEDNAKDYGDGVTFAQALKVLYTIQTMKHWRLQGEWNTYERKRYSRPKGLKWTVSKPHEKWETPKTAGLEKQEEFLEYFTEHQRAAAFETWKDILKSPYFSCNRVHHDHFKEESIYRFQLSPNAMEGLAMVYAEQLENPASDKPRAPQEPKRDWL